MKKILVAAMMAGALAGCGNLKLQWSASYMTDNLKADLEEAHQAAKPVPPPSPPATQTQP